MEHDGAIDGLGLSPSGTSVLCLTSLGALGSLNLEQQTYKTLLRGHSAAICGSSVNGRRTKLATASLDGSIRVWGCAPTMPSGLKQLYEFAVRPAAGMSGEGGGGGFPLVPSFQVRY